MSAIIGAESGVVDAEWQPSLRAGTVCDARLIAFPSFL